MPGLRKQRIRRVHYKLVHPSYEDKDYGERGEATWVKESDLRRHARADPVRAHQLAVTGGGDDSRPRSHRRVHFEDEPTEGRGEEEDEEEWEWDNDEEGEWEEQFEEDVGDAKHDSRHFSASSRAGEGAEDGAYAQRLMGEWGEEDPAWLAARKPQHMMTEAELDAARQKETKEYMNKRNMHMAHDEEGAGDDDKLFEDEVECEVTDDFLHQLVFGSGGDAGEGGEEEEQDGDCDDDDDMEFIDEEDAEMWRLLTEEEREGVRAARQRGTARRRKATGAGADTEDYIEHDVTQRALDRQFTAMMREFNVDARLNDAYVDDPRTHGPLSMDKYMKALEEFVVDRAGVNLETAEPQKNKGLIQQLQYLSRRAGAFDTDRQGGVFVTTLLPDKQSRFVEEFRQGTDDIRRAAKLRILQRLVAERQAAAAAVAATGQPNASLDAAAAQLATLAERLSLPATALPLAEDAQEEEEYEIKEIKPKADRMDCETVVSAYSTYYNQPNIIKAPSSKKAKSAQQRGGQKRRVPVAVSDDDNDDDYDDTHGDGGAYTDEPPTSTSIPTERPKDETKEEKKQRRQAVKAAQRERRQEKSNLKKAYRDMEAEEVKRASTSQKARRNVHFV